MNTVQRSPRRAGLADASAKLREFLLDGDSQLLRLLFQEGARARGAGLVHGEVHHHALIDADEFGILPADFENRVHGVHAHLLADVHGAGLVRGDFVVHGVRAHQFANQLAAGARGAYAANVERLRPSSASISFRPRSTTSMGRPCVRR